MNPKFVMQILKSAPKLFIAAGLLLVLNIALFGYGIFHQRNIDRLQSRWSEGRKALSGGGQDTTAFFRQGENDLKSWRERIIPKKYFARFVGNLFELGAHNSLMFSNISYKPSELKERGLVSYVLDFNVTGTYARIKSFVSDMGRMKEIFTIDNISLNNTNPTSDSVGLKVQLTVYLKPEE